MCIVVHTQAFMILPKVVPASGLETDETMTKPKPSLSPRRISTSYGCTAVLTTAVPGPPAPPPLPMPLVLPEPELTVFREFWEPCGVRFSSVSEGAWLLLWWDEAGDGGTSPSTLATEEDEEEDEEDRIKQLLVAESELPTSSHHANRCLNNLLCSATQELGLTGHLSEKWMVERVC